MPENTAPTPEKPVDTPSQQAPATPPTNAGEDWKARYDGMVKAMQERVERNKQLEAELANKVSEIERLNSQLGLKDVEKTAAVGDRDKTIEELTKSSLEAQKELERLKALELKIQVANELGAPELIKIADTIPNMTDKDALAVVMKNINEYAAMQVKAREAQLLAGTGIVAGTAPANVSAPASQDEWIRKIESEPLGSKKRAQLMDDYGVWLENTHRR